MISIYYHFYQGRFKVPLEEPMVLLPSMPPLRINDLPSFIDGTGSYPSLQNLVLSQFSNIEEPNWLFCNSFDKLEDEVSIYTWHTFFELWFSGKDLKYFFNCKFNIIELSFTAITYLHIYFPKLFILIKPVVLRMFCLLQSGS